MVFFCDKSPPPHITSIRSYKILEGLLLELKWSRLIQEPQGWTLDAAVRHPGPPVAGLKLSSPSCWGCCKPTVFSWVLLWDLAWVEEMCFAQGLAPFQEQFTSSVWLLWGYQGPVLSLQFRTTLECHPAFRISFRISWGFCSDCSTRQLLSLLTFACPWEYSLIHTLHSVSVFTGNPVYDHLSTSFQTPL